MTVKEMRPGGRPAGRCHLCYARTMMTPVMATSMILQPQRVVGKWRRFGSIGPVYEIVAASDELPEGDRMMRVRMIKTGEEVD